MEKTLDPASLVVTAICFGFLVLIGLGIYGTVKVARKRRDQV